MVDTITVTDLHQAGRSNAPDPSLPRISLNYNADFSAAASIELDFTLINQQMQFGTVRAVFVDNGSSNSEIAVSVSGTDQFFTIPAYAQGNFVINAAQQSRLKFDTDGGATDTVTITVYNYDVAPCVWYSYGTLNFNTVLPSQGSMPEGTDVATDPDNAPVYIGVIDRATGLFHGVSGDANGRINVNAIVDDSVPIDVAVTNAPALQGAYTPTAIVALSGASENLFAANANRRFLSVTNINAANPIGINLAGGVAAIGATGTITIPFGQTFRIDNYPPNGVITIIGTAADLVTAYEG